MDFSDKTLNKYAVSNRKLKGSVNIPLDQIGDKPDELKEKESKVVFCRSENRSGQTKSIQGQKDLENVFNHGILREVDKLIK